MEFSSYTQFYEDCKQFGMDYAVSHAAALGFDAVEYLALPYTEHPKSVQDFKTLLSRHGLSISCYTVYVQLFTPDADEVERQMLQHVEAAAELGAKYLHHTLFPVYKKERIRHTYEEVWDGIVAMAERIAKACNRHGITCLYEPQGAYFNGVKGLRAFLNEMRQRGCDVGICGDFGNSLFVDVDPREVFRAFASDIRHIHIKDYQFVHSEHPEQKLHRSAGGKLFCDAPVGQGAVDFATGFEELKKAGYHGAISFESAGSDTELTAAVSFIKELMKQAGF